MKKLHIIITCSIIISCLILLVNAKDIMHNQTTIENATITEMLTSWEYWTCDFDKDWLTTAADVMIFQNECSLEDWRQSEICDLNNDWKFNSVDITVYNDSCYWKLLWYESNENNNNDNNNDQYEFWTISIANPNNPSEWITIMDRNLWATSNDITSSDSYWYYYQRWNNYGFQNNQINMSYELADLSQYWPNRPYNNKIFVRWRFDDYYQHYSNRASPDNENIRWWWEDSFENQWWYKLNKLKERQWPCPDGYHVPSGYELWLLIKYWAESNNVEYDSPNEELPPDYVSYLYRLKGHYSDFYNYFHLPIAGTIHAGNGEIVDKTHWVYWTSSPYINPNYNDSSITLTLHQLYVWIGNGSRARWNSIRCFKNTYEPEFTTNSKDITDCDEATIKLACTDQRPEIYETCPRICRSDEITENKCDLNNDKIINATDFTRFYENCDLTNWKDSDKCDLNNDWKFNSADITVLNNVCYGKLLWTEPENKKLTWDKENIKGKDDIKQGGEQAEKVQATTQKATIKNTNQKQSYWRTDMDDAYQFARKNWITTVGIDKARMNSPLTRIAMAKMLSNYAINVLWKDPDLAKWTPFFNDVTNKLNKQYDNAVTLSYQLGIMWINMKNNNFRPYDEVTRAEFATALSRMLYNTEDWKWSIKYYEPHISKLYNEWIITNKNGKMKEKRWYVMTMLMRTAE